MCVCGGGGGGGAEGEGGSVGSPELGKSFLTIALFETL